MAPPVAVRPVRSVRPSGLRRRPAPPMERSALARPAPSQPIRNPPTLNPPTLDHLAQTPTRDQPAQTQPAQTAEDQTPKDQTPEDQSAQARMTIARPNLVRAARPVGRLGSPRRLAAGPPALRLAELPTPGGPWPAHPFRPA